MCSPMLPDPAAVALSWSSRPGSTSGARTGTAYLGTDGQAPAGNWAPVFESESSVAFHQERDKEAVSMA